MKRRSVDVFSLSLLDCICCGFGATLLLYVIFNMTVARRVLVVTEDRRAETDRLEREVREGELGLVELRNAIDTTRAREVEAHGLSRRVLAELEKLRQELSTYDESNLARRESLARLKTDIQTLEQETRRLSAAAPSDEIPGAKLRAHFGDGDRQYLTGLKVGGRRILVLVDASASMLDETLVNVIRRRNLPDAQKRQADKWRRAVASVDWLTTQFPRDARFQLYTFHESAQPVVPGSAGNWLDASSRTALDDAMRRLGEVVPGGGTSLANAFAAARALSPPPDNVILLTDGLPTQGPRPARGGTVSARERLRLFERAIGELPSRVPVNVILFPMEGDPLAASAFWKLAIATHGSYLNPAKDWP